MKNPKNEELASKIEGKTIAEIDMSSCNVWKFHFTDGSSVEIETVPVGMGLYGMELQSLTYPDPE